MECGICRSPFKIEYFEGDVELLEIYKSITQEQGINQNQNNIIINNNHNNHNNIINQNSSFLYNMRNLARQNERDRHIQIRDLSFGNDNIFIVLFHPNKFLCLITFLLNILLSDLGTFILGVRYFNLYEIVLSLIQFGFCYPFIILANKIIKTRHFLGLEVNNFLFIYLLIVAIICYLSSIYVGIFHNFVFFNQIKIKNKEISICILILNIILGGVGTILYGIIIKVNENECCYRFECLSVGIFEVFAFMCSIFIISLKNFMEITPLLSLGFLIYALSIYNGIRIYKKMNNLSFN